MHYESSRDIRYGRDSDAIRKNNLLIMFKNAFMICLLFICNIKAPGICSGFPCCSKPVSNPDFDPKGKAYGFENGESCVILLLY